MIAAVFLTMLAAYGGGVVLALPFALREFWRDCPPDLPVPVGILLYCVFWPVMLWIAVDDYRVHRRRVRDNLSSGEVNNV